MERGCLSKLFDGRFSKLRILLRVAPELIEVRWSVLQGGNFMDARIFRWARIQFKAIVGKSCNNFRDEISAPAVSLRIVWSEGYNPSMGPYFLNNRSRDLMKFLRDSLSDLGERMV